MELLATVLAAVLKILVPAIVKGSRDTYADAAPQKTVTRKLKKAIDAIWDVAIKKQKHFD